jgi:GT2 family glycosyltransferase
MTSVIIIQFNNGGLTVDAIRSLRQYHAEELEIIVVDNASTDNSRDLVNGSCEGIALLANTTNRGFSAANNQAAQIAQGDLLCFLNNDTICRSPFLVTARNRFNAVPDLGVWGPRLIYVDGTFQLSAGRLPGFWGETFEKVLYALERRRVRLVIAGLDRRYSRRQAVGWVTGAVLVMRRSMFQDLGGFDEELFMYFEDKDLCARTWQRGATVVFDPGESVVHLKGGSSTEGLTVFLGQVYRKSQQHYYGKHRPAYEQRLLALYHRLIGVTIGH